ncbi:hypothetical protein [Thiobacillus sp.]|uniref:hypothetical protein n=1 Tax=Thiobacillus sp. TaxID=924 RepID=UPI0025F31BBE|nr:hypothetical protein [Thiobacillus sp.]MBT9540740.1 hypothetical protein [Thiobacillus sp.]
MRVIALLCLLSGLPSPSTQAAEGKFSVNLGLDYSSGNYGSQTITETWAMPLSLKYRTDNWNLRLSTAWLRVEGDGSVTPEGDPLNASGSPSTTTEGMGDISARATYSLLDERSNWAGVELSGKIKFGTASEAKALGTGKNDYSLQAGIFKPIDNWMPFLDVGYKWKGDPNGIEYRNVWLGSVGTDYRITPTLSFGGSYDWQQAVTASSSPISEAMLYLNFHLNADQRLNLYAVGGFSEASPDWGSGLIFTYRY